MCLKLITLLLCSLVVVAGCGSSSTQPSANESQTAAETNKASSASASPASQPGGPSKPMDALSVKPRVDACALLTSKEIEAVQGEGVKETKLTGQSTGGFIVSQCFFTLPTFTNSVSLLVAQKGEGSAASDPKEFWRDTFHEYKQKEKDQDVAGGRKKGEEEEESSPPQKVAGIGDEAFWTSSRVGGALYVLKGNAYVRISVGGPSDQATKMKRSGALARKALARL